MLPRAVSIFLLILFSLGVEHAVASPVAARPNPQWRNGQAVLQPTPIASQSSRGSLASRLTTTFAPSTMATVVVLKREASSLDASSISSVLATGLPISILSLAATNPAAASSWIASEVLQTKPTGSWYRALPTDVQAYLVAAASAAATATATASPSSPSASASVQASVDAKTYSYSAAAYHMSAGAVAAVVFGTIGFVMLCYGLFAWQARLGPFERWAPRDRPRHHGEGYERAASRAALQREFMGSKLDLSVYDDGGEVVELREGVGAKDGKGKAVQGGVVVAGGDTGEAGKDGVGGDGGGTNGRPQSGGRESVVTALPRYRPSVFGNAAGWKAGWPSVWLSRR